MKKRILTLALALIMCMTVISMTAVAAETEESITIKIPGCEAIFTLENASAEYGIVTENGLTVYRIALPGNAGKITCDKPVDALYDDVWEDINPSDSGFGGGDALLPAGWSEVYPERWLSMSGKGLRSVTLTVNDDGSLVSGSNSAVAYIEFYLGYPVHLESWDFQYPEDLISWETTGWYEREVVEIEKHPLSTLAVADPAAPSSWAAEEVNAAIEAGLVPDSILNAGWQNATTRLAAAEALTLVLEESLGKAMDEIAAEKGWDLSVPYFSDTDSKAVTFLGYAGVTTGIGDNKYGPDGEYNRAQMVTMIGRAAENLLGADAQGDNPFTDEVPGWAAPYVGYAANAGITTGISVTEFGSYNVLQNQQTAIFCLRTFNVFSM